MTSTWVADPLVNWTILLSVRASDLPPPAEIRHHLASLNRELGGADDDALVTSWTEEVLARRALAAATTHPVTAAVVGDTLMISAHHHHLDGLGLLAAASRLTDRPIASSARGLGARETRTTASAGRWDRLAEVALRPPDRVPGLGGAGGRPGDSFASTSVAGTVFTSQLAWAAVRGVARFTARHGGTVRRPVVAVGASRLGGGEPRLGDHSALVRLTDLAGVEAEELRSRLATAGLEPDPGGGQPSRIGARLTRVALRVLAPRLGSTVLVSHLGVVQGEGLDAVSFHPVTGGGSGVSIGAVTLGERTVITARGRLARHSDDALAELLGDITTALAQA